jgi:RNA polymerase sigma factor (sigma-70 family)
MDTNEANLEALVERARAGERPALEALLAAVRDRVYHLALRMLGDPADAQDAAQEILIKVMTHLSTFRGESAFTTWVYRVAANHLLTARQRRMELVGLTFEAVAAQLDAGLAASAGHPEATDPVLIEECKIVCTQGMLMCLDREHRLAFVLGEILELSSDEAAAIAGAEAATFRKRLQRARERLDEFMSCRCGVANPDNACRCARQAPVAARLGVIDGAQPRFARHPAQARAAARAIEGLQSAAEVLRSHPDYVAPAAFAEGMRRLLDEGRLQPLEE